MFYFDTLPALVHRSRDGGRLERVCRDLLRAHFARDAIEALENLWVHLKASSRRIPAFANVSVDTSNSRLCALQLWMFA